MQQDNGRFAQLDEEFCAEAINNAHQAQADLLAKQDSDWEDGDENQPEKEEIHEQAKRNPGLVFKVGDKVKVKEGDFKIISIGKKRMILEGLPGTRIK